MVDAFRRRSPLAHRGLPARAVLDAARRESAEIVLSERPHRCQVNLRGRLSNEQPFDRPYGPCSLDDRVALDSGAELRLEDRSCRTGRKRARRRGRSPRPMVAHLDHAPGPPFTTPLTHGGDARRRTSSPGGLSAASDNDNVASLAALWSPLKINCNAPPDSHVICRASSRDHIVSQ